MIFIFPKKKRATFVAPFFGYPYQRVLSIEPFFPKENFPSCSFPSQAFALVPLCNHPLLLNMSQSISLNTFNKPLMTKISFDIDCFLSKKEIFDVNQPIGRYSSYRSSMYQCAC
jgi:hypothetical protein